MALVHLGLGTNLGDRRVNLAAALAGLGRLPGTRVAKTAGVYQTPPMGGPPGQGEYLNSACLVETELTPRELLAAIHRLEREIGRRRDAEAERWGPRVIDIDILLWEDLVLDEPDLIIPHPRLAERAFALLPLAELAAERIHPGNGCQVRELLERIGTSHEGIQRLPL